MNIVLEKASLSNFSSYHKLLSEPQIMHWSGFDTPPDYDTLFEKYQKVIHGDKRIILLFFDKDTEDYECLGFFYLDFMPEKPGVLELAYGIKDNRSGMGLGSKSMNMTINYITESLSHIKELNAWIFDDNISSIRMVEKNGFVSTGVTKMVNYFNESKPQRCYTLMLK